MLWRMRQAVSQRRVGGAKTWRRNMSSQVKEAKAVEAEVEAAGENLWTGKIKTRGVRRPPEDWVGYDSTGQSSKTSGVLDNPGIYLAIIFGAIGCYAYRARVRSVRTSEVETQVKDSVVIAPQEMTELRDENNVTCELFCSVLCCSVSPSLSRYSAPIPLLLLILPQATWSPPSVPMYPPLFPPSCFTPLSLGSPLSSPVFPRSCPPPSLLLGVSCSFSVPPSPGSVPCAKSS